MTFRPLSINELNGDVPLRFHEECLYMLMCAHAFPTIHPQWISIGFALPGTAISNPRKTISSKWSRCETGYYLVDLFFVGSFAISATIRNALLTDWASGNMAVPSSTSVQDLTSR